MPLDFVFSENPKNENLKPTFVLKDYGLDFIDPILIL